MMEAVSTQTRVDAACRRCGTCCRKGGPSLHREDGPLIEEGRIPVEQLYTLREGETAYDNVQDRLIRLTGDVIKIKDRKDGKGCAWLNSARNGCVGYADRPIECRVLQCRDTREIEAVYCRRRLTREDLVGKVQGLWELLADHQNRCDPRRAEALIRGIDLLRTESPKSTEESSPESESLAELNHILQYDRQLRLILVQDGGIHPDRIEFLLGRPLWEILRVPGVDIRMRNGRFVWVKIGEKGVNPLC